MDMQHSLSNDIDLSGEPSGINAYMVLPADTTQESQNLGLMVERLCSECAIAARVRQYYGGNREDFYDLLRWTTLNVSEDNALTISVDKPAVQAGGKTILELKMTSSNSLPFVSGAKVVLTNPWTIQTLLIPQNHVATICDGGDDYRFGFNGQEKDNERAGIGNWLDFGERGYDPRTTRFPTPDPLYKKYPGVSPYTFAGLNPILNIDKKGLTKTTYTVVIDEQNGNTLIKKETAPGLMSVPYTSMQSGIKTYDWYDYSVVNVTTIGKDRKTTTTSSGTIRGADRNTNTLFNSEKYAQLKADDFAEKDGSSRDGIVMTTKSRLFPGNGHNLNTSGRGQEVNIDEISAAFGVAGGAMGVNIPGLRRSYEGFDGDAKMVEALLYLRGGVLGANDGQGLAPVNFNGNDTFNCDVENGCGQLHVTDTNGNTQVGVPVPQGKSKDDYRAK